MREIKLYAVIMGKLIPETNYLKAQYFAAYIFTDKSLSRKSNFIRVQLENMQGAKTS